MTRETEFKGNNRGAPDLNLNTEISSTKDDGTEYTKNLEALLLALKDSTKDADSPKYRQSEFEMLALAVRYIPRHELTNAVDYVRKYGTDLIVVFAVIAFPVNISKRGIFGACHSSVGALPGNCATFISTLPEDPMAWARFVEEEKSKAEPIHKVVRLLGLVNPRHVDDTERFQPTGILRFSEFYAGLYDSLGEITVSFMLDGMRALPFALAYRNFFKQAADLIWADTRFSPEEKREALFSFPYLRINELRAQENLLSLIRTFGADATHCYPAIYEAEDAAEAAMRCIAVNRALKGNSVEIFKAYGKEALDRYEQFWPFFQGMLHRLESTGEVRQCARVFQICCQNSLIEKFGDHLLKVADSKELAPEVILIAQVFKNLKRLPDEEISELVSKIIELCRVCPPMFPELISGLNGTTYKRIDKHFAFIKRVFELDIYHASEILKAISWEEYESSPKEFQGMIETWKKSMWGMMRAYRRSDANSMSDFLNHYGKEAVAIREFAKSGSGKLFSLMPAKKWESLGLPYAELFGESAGWVYSRAMLRKKETPDLIPNPRWLLDSERFRKLYDENKKHMGIIHAERYLDPKIVIHGELDKSSEDKLLRRFEENLRCLDPDYKKDRKLAVVVLPHYDINGAFRHQAHSEYKQLRALGYKVVLCESNTGKGALDAVRAVVERHRGCDGEVAKGAHYVALLAHANFDYSAWGDPETRGDDSFLSKDLEEDLRFRDMLSPDNAVVNIGGCLVGRGGTRAKNLSRIIRDWNQGSTFLANPGCFSLSRFVLDESGQKIIGLREGGSSADTGESQATKFFF